MTEGKTMFWTTAVFALAFVVIPSLVLDAVGYYDWLDRVAPVVCQ